MFEKASGPEDKNQNKDKKRKEIDRREFLKRAGAGTGALAAFFSAPFIDDLFDGNKRRPEAMRAHGWEIPSGAVEVETGALAGQVVDDLFKVHLGLSDRLDPKGDIPESQTSKRIPKKINVNYADQLKALWDIKAETNNIYEVARETGNELISEYENIQRIGMNLNSYAEEINAVVAEMNDRIEWSDLKAFYGLSDSKTNLLQNISGEIGGQELLSYSLTELVPSYDGDFNAKVYELLLQKAGCNYIERVPAVHDNYTSFGPYQFTAKALFATPSGRHGASKAAQHVSGQRVPGSVSDLRGTDHHRVAHLLAVHNLSNLLERLDRDSLTVLQNGWKDKRSDLAQFIAAAHNYPYSTKYANGALLAGEYWLANDMEDPFYISCGDHTRPYAEKTRENYEALATMI